MMRGLKRIAVIGGDERQIYLASALARMGWQVAAYGLGNCEERLCPAAAVETLSACVAEASAIVLPMPASVDGVRVSCPLAPDTAPRFTTVLENRNGALVIGGKLPPVLSTLTQETEQIDLIDDEVLQLKNALPTAEGAISIAMRELPVTIDGIHAAVIGYGRIGEILADKLYALGANVYVYARRKEALTRAALRHAHPMQMVNRDGTSTLGQIPRNCRVIFNTVPHQIFTREVVETLPRACVYIDLASAPGGIDWSAAGELGIRAVWGSGLPGKCVPETAGILLAETVDEILRAKGVDLC